MSLKPIAFKLLLAVALLWPLPAVRSTSWAAPSAAPTYTVNDTTDLPGAPPLDDANCAAANGHCTLRAAVMEANHTPGGGVTIIVPAGTYVLSGTIPTSNGIDITATVTILGAGASQTIIDANGGVTFGRAFRVESGAVVTMTGVTLQHGRSSSIGGALVNLGQLSLNNSAVISNTEYGSGSFGDGGGLTNVGTLTVTNSLIRGNSSNDMGGGIYTSDGTTTLVNSSIMGNSAVLQGGGLAVDHAHVFVTRSTVSGNQGSQGGGVYSVNDATTTLLDTTVSGNTATGDGGGVANAGADTALVNSTVSGNLADLDGGGIWNSCNCANLVELYNATVANNDADADHNGIGAGGGISSSAQLNNIVQLQNSLIAGNFETLAIGINHPFTPNDCRGRLTSVDYNLISTSAFCSPSPSAHDQIGVPAGLGPLQNNGGTTFTHALLAGSLAINAANPDGCLDNHAASLAVDQRGFLRPATGVGLLICDIGAFEFQRSLFLPLVRR